MIENQDWESEFGPPQQAAADLMELRWWAQARTSMQPTTASALAREECLSIDPEWPARALTNERLSIPNGKRKRVSGVRILKVDSTLEVMSTVAQGSNPSTAKRVSPRSFETLWPAQVNSWMTWVSSVLDDEDPRPFEIGDMPQGTPSVPTAPAVLMMAVRGGGDAYLEEVASHLPPQPEFWKFGCTVPSMPAHWFRGLEDAGGVVLQHFPNGELAMWLRSAVCNGWFTSTQLAHYMGVQTARSCNESWI